MVDSSNRCRESHRSDTRVAVFTAGVDGFGSYRIPAILGLPGDTLLALCEGRKFLGDHAENKILLKTSEDLGRTWSGMTIVADAGENSLNNPLVVRDAVSGDVVLMYQEYPFTMPDAVDDRARWISHAGQNFHPNYHEGAVVEGYEGNTCRTYVQRSSDRGESWTERAEITRQVKRPVVVTSYAGGPGIGIQIVNEKYRNRLIMPFTQGPWDCMKVYAVFSDDGGHSWRYGDVAPTVHGEHANEVQMAELADGRLILNARSFHGNGLRKIAYSDDGGSTWSCLDDAPGLVEPECQGSMISILRSGSKSGLLYCGPESVSERRQGALKQSMDGGLSWQRVGTVCDGFFAYSSICQLSESQVGVLFESDGYNAISFSTVTIGCQQGSSP